MFCFYTITLDIVQEINSEMKFLSIGVLPFHIPYVGGSQGNVCTLWVVLV